MTRVAAVGDIHVGEDCEGCLNLTGVNDDADVLLLAGDLTRVGSAEEARVLGQELSGVDVPIVAVLGNHDYQSDSQIEVIFALTAAGGRRAGGRAGSREGRWRHSWHRGDKGLWRRVRRRVRHGVRRT